MSRFLQFDNVAFSYPGMAEPLLGGVTAHFPEGAWTGIVGANGAGKTTLLKLAAGELAPTGGRIRQIGSAQYAVQRTDAAPDEWLAFMDSWDPPAIDARALLGVEPEWTDRWDTLRHGERKRAQIAAALWRRPDVLALDEPTNHLDARAKGVLLAALKSFRGVGLLVSHDRDFLEERAEMKNETVLFEAKDGSFAMPVQVKAETVWLSLSQMAQLFERDKTVVFRHVKNAIADGEIDPKVTIANFAMVTPHGAVPGKTRVQNVDCYNLDVIISVGYRVKSRRGVEFCRWQLTQSGTTVRLTMGSSIPDRT